jgi:hypothetical protein
LQRPDEGARKTGKGRSKRENHGIERPDIDPERGDHFPIGLAGADAHAETGP